MPFSQLVLSVFMVASEIPASGFSLIRILMCDHVCSKAAVHPYMHSETLKECSSRAMDSNLDRKDTLPVIVEPWKISSTTENPPVKPSYLRAMPLRLKSFMALLLLALQ
jgi:hypothetical protein